MSDTLMRVFGWRALLVHGDPCVLDRWLWLRRHLRGGPLRTFDAGSGNGGFSIYAGLVGNDVVAASFSQTEQQAGRRRAAIVGAASVDFEQLDLRELSAHSARLGAFDQIICFETIEHLTDDAGLVVTLAGMLAPGGSLLLTAPYDGHRPLYSEEREPSPVEDGSHVRYGYSPEALRTLVQAAGLEVLAEDFLSGVVSQRVTDLMRRLTRRFGAAPAWAIVLPLRALVVLDRPLSRMLRYPCLSVAVQAVKPI